jgi:hypothetical protein
MDLVLNLMNSDHILLTFHFDIHHLCMVTQAVCPLPTKILSAFLISPLRVICPAILILVDLKIPVIFGKEYSYKDPYYAFFSTLRLFLS